MQEFLRKRETLAHSLATGLKPNPNLFLRESLLYGCNLPMKEYVLPDGSRHGRATTTFSGQRKDNPTLVVTYKFGKMHGPSSFSSRKEGSFAGQYENGLPQGLFVFDCGFSMVFDKGLPVLTKDKKGDVERLEWDTKKRTLVFKGKKYFNVRVVGNTAFANDFYEAKRLLITPEIKGVRFLMRWSPHVIADTIKDKKIQELHLDIPIFF